MCKFFCIFSQNSAPHTKKAAFLPPSSLNNRELCFRSSRYFFHSRLNARLQFRKLILHFVHQRVQQPRQRELTKNGSKMPYRRLSIIVNIQIYCTRCPIMVYNCPLISMNNCPWMITLTATGATSTCSTFSIERGSSFA